jgi:hypothetical protein
MDATEDPKLRRLTAGEYADILTEEGMKPAFLVAEDHNLETWRVRAIWNGEEPEPDA